MGWSLFCGDPGTTGRALTDTLRSGDRRGWAHWEVRAHPPRRSLLQTEGSFIVGFSTGDTVVHPRHGVATVQATATRGSGDAERSYLELFFEPKSMTIMVPVDSLDEVGIRKPVSKKEASAILAILEEESDVSAVWAERNGITQSRVQSTELEQASMVIRDLTRHAQNSGKPLSPSENGMLESCLDSVAVELSLALGQSVEDTRALILDKVGFPAV